MKSAITGYITTEKSMIVKRVIAFTRNKMKPIWTDDTNKWVTTHQPGRGSRWFGPNDPQAQAQRTVLKCNKKNTIVSTWFGDSTCTTSYSPDSIDRVHGSECPILLFMILFEHVQPNSSPCKCTVSIWELTCGVRQKLLSTSGSDKVRKAIKLGIRPSCALRQHPHMFCGQLRNVYTMFDARTGHKTCISLDYHIRHCARHTVHDHQITINSEMRGGI